MSENNLETLLFEHEQFGQIRGVLIDGEPWLVGKDVALALGYKNPQKAIRDHVDDEDRTVNDSFTVNGTALVLINESGMYSLVLGSELPSAKKFKRWLTSEVLPAIRKTGGYLSEQLQNQLTAELVKLYSDYASWEEEHSRLVFKGKMLRKQIDWMEKIHSLFVKGS